MTFAGYRVILSGLYSRMSGELQEIMATKPSRWLLIRKDVRLIRRQIESGGRKMGIQEMRLKMNMKQCEKKLSAPAQLVPTRKRTSRMY